MDPARTERLKAFGLSDSAARAYLALLELGLTEARDVSRLARIPLAKVYQTLGQLHERGLANALPTTPRKYEAVPIGAYLAKLRERHMQEAAELERLTPELEAMFPLHPGTDLADRGGITVVKGRQETLAAIRSAVAKATHDVLIVPSLGWTKRPQHMRALLEGTASRGIRARVLTHPPEKGNADAASYLDVADVRARQYVEPGADAVSAYFVDGRKAILAHHVPDDASTNRGKDATLVVEERALVAAIQCHAEARWEASAALQDHGPIPGRLKPPR